MTEKVLRATHGAPDRPLRIGEIEIPCYVLENGTRVVVRNNMIRSLGMTTGTASGTSNDRLLNFALGRSIKPFISDDLLEMMKRPLRFKLPYGKGGFAYGYDATVLVDICEAVLNARKADSLRTTQLHIATRCEVLIRGFARVGIIALVDEATGYQEVRDRMALQAILDQYLRKELAAWAKKFPDEFYQEMYKLKGWTWPVPHGRRTPLVGLYTNDLIYERLAPGLLSKLQEINPKDERGNRKAKHHQWLTEDIGDPALAQHLFAVMSFMRASASWEHFYRMMQRAFPKRNTTLLLPLPDVETNPGS